MIPPETRWSRERLASVESVVIDIDLDDLRLAADELTAAGRNPIEVAAADLPLGSADSGVHTLQKALAEGPGIAIVRGFPVGDASEPTIELMFWRLGLALGTPVSQSVMGELLGHVIDRTDVDPDARAYRRNEELTPHTDPADYLSFLCLEPATEGGTNHFVSSLEIHEILRAERPDLLERLARGYRYSRFGEQADDEESITPYRVPVFSVRDGLISCRLVRQYIEIAADEDPEIGLDELDIEALDMVDTLALDPTRALTFTLQSGEAVFANNYTVLHSRTAFSDTPGSPRRHLLRLWLDGDPGRPVVPETRIYPRSAGIPPQPGRTPSYATDVDIL